MYKRLLEFCNKFNIINKNQYGFQKHKSTNLAIHHLINTLLTNINDNYLTTGLFFDLTKAFDFVSHDLLLNKLEKIGIRGITLQWIASYLTNRTQCVTITKLINKELRTYKSNCLENINGVPQGSILGPILFILYINDISDATSHECITYADDISVIVRTKKNKNSIYNHELDINNTIDNIIEWLQAHNLKINLAKSNFIPLNKSKHNQHNFKLNIIKINQIEKTKFLGVVIDQNLNWKAHIDEVCNKVNKCSYALNQIKKVTDIKTSVMTYRAYAESILRYGLVMWGNSSDWNRAFIAQKKCIRAICGVRPDESCQPLFKGLGILPLPTIYILEVCVFVQRHKQLFEKACEVQTTRSRRDPHKLVLKDIPKSQKYGKSCLTMCVRIYNKLPDELKTLNITLFKKKLYKWLNENNFYSVKQFLEKN